METVVPCVQRSSRQKSSSKMLLSVFRDKDGILLADCLGKGVTIMAMDYVALLDRLKQQLVSKRRNKLSKGILFLQDSAAPHKGPFPTRNWQVFSLKF
jgi:hypothetical protein